MKITIQDTKETKQNLIRFSDLENGDVFQWRNENNHVFSLEVFIMLDKSLERNGQCYNLSEKEMTWFSSYDNSVFRVFGKMTLSEARETV